MHPPPASSRHRTAVLAIAMVVGSAGCAPRTAVLLPERPPAPLDHPIGVKEDSPAGSKGDPPSPATGVPIGSADPVRLVAAARDGQWVASCRRAGSAEDASWSPRLVVVRPEGTQESVFVDRFVAFDPTGRHVSFVQDGALMLLDTAAGSGVRLRDLEPWEQTARSHPWVHFDRAGERVAYFAATDDGLRVRVRSLQDRGEREIDPGPLDASSATVRLEPNRFVRIDLAGPGRAEPGSFDGFPSACRPTSVGFPAASETRYARVDVGEPARVVPGAIATWQSGLVVRRGDGTLIWQRDAAQNELADAACGGRVLHREVGGSRLLVACMAQSPAAVRVYATPGTGDDAYIELGTFAADALDGDEGWVDRDRGQILLAEPPRLLEVEQVEAILHATPHHVLVRRAADYALVALEDPGQTRALGEIVGEASSPVLHAGPMAVVMTDTSAWIIDLARGRVHGRTDRRPLAVTRSGHVLVTMDPDATDPEGTFRGPLVWLDPVASGPSVDVGDSAT